MANGVLVLVEQRENRLRKAGIEALSEGRRIADSLSQPLSEPHCRTFIASWHHSTRHVAGAPVASTY